MPPSRARTDALTSGEFGRRTGLSIKALRLSDPFTHIVRPVARGAR